MKYMSASQNVRCNLEMGTEISDTQRDQSALPLHGNPTPDRRALGKRTVLGRTPNISHRRNCGTFSSSDSWANSRLPERQWPARPTHCKRPGCEARQAQIHMGKRNSCRSGSDSPSLPRRVAPLRQQRGQHSATRFIFALLVTRRTRG
jgi:hypothetical protein